MGLALSSLATWAGFDCALLLRLKSNSRHHQMEVGVQIRDLVLGMHVEDPVGLHCSVHMIPGAVAPVLDPALFAEDLAETRPAVSVATRRDAPDSCRFANGLSVLKMVAFAERVTRWGDFSE